MQTTYSRASFRVGKATYQGTRANQEDSFFAGQVVPNKPWLGVISDGMGGHQAGDIASRLGVQVVRETFEATAKNGRSIPAALKGAVESAHRAVLRKAEAIGQAGNMGATVVAFSVVGDMLFWCSAGDSRLYLFRGERLSQLTRDFTLAADLESAIKGGHVSKEAVEANPQKAALTSFLGTDKFRTDDGSIRLRTGDFVVGCTDGVYGTVGAGGISEACSRASGSGDQAAEIAVDTLFGEFLFPQQKANQDNSTAIVLSFNAISGAGRSARVASGWSSAVFHPYSKMAIAIVALVGFGFAFNGLLEAFVKPEPVKAHSETALPKAPSLISAKETERQEAKPPVGESIAPSVREKAGPSATESNDAGRLSAAKDMLAKAKQESPQRALPLIEHTIDIAKGLSESRSAKIRDEAKALLDEARKIEAKKQANVVRKIERTGRAPEYTNITVVPPQADPSAEPKLPLDSKGNSPLPSLAPGRGAVQPSDPAIGEAKEVGKPGTEKAATATPPSVRSDLQRSVQEPVAVPDAATTGVAPIRDSVAPSKPMPIGAVPAHSKSGASDVSGNSREKQ